MRRQGAALAAVAVALVALVGPSTTASAAFPGTNGRIAFSTDFSHPSEVYTMRPDGAGLRQLTNFPGGHGATQPDVSPDGRRIVFTHRGQIWVMNGDGSGQRRLTDDVGAVSKDPSWSPDGTRILFSRCTFPFGAERCGIDVMGADGTGRTKLLGGNWQSGHPVYSPDGRTIAFASNRGGYVSNVWVMASNGTGLKRLTDPALQASQPDWSPDGTHIVFGTHAELPGSNIWSMRADGTGQHALIDLPPDGDAPEARFSPDGTKIVLIANFLHPTVCCWDVFYMNPDGSDLHVIANRHPGVVSLDWGVRPAP